jgi:aryl-alcohol dehydrogenase-like predicted oxidoreductase
MELRRLGNSGAVVSAWCLGTMTFGAEADEATSFAIMDAYVAAGGNFFDSADVYSNGVSETIVGRWLKARTEAAKQVVVATKARFPTGTGPNDIGLSRRHLSVALDASLKRLGVERIDLYQMHAWDALTPLEETLRFLDDAVHSGKIGYYGFSNYIGWQVTKAAQIAQRYQFAAPVTLQPQYNLLMRDVELEVIPACLDAGIGLLPWSPLAGGWLTGKYKRDQMPTGATRVGENPQRGGEAFVPRNAQERTWSVLGALEAVAKARGGSMAEVALGWLVDRPSVTSVILGARTVEQFNENLKAANVKLTADEIAALDAPSRPPVTDYPYGVGGHQAADAADCGRARAVKPIFSDPTPRWVPFATAGVIIACVWGGSVWQQMDIVFVTQFSIGLAVVMLVGILLQGRLFWRDQIDHVTSDGRNFEAVTSVWVGGGRTVSFAPHETSEWVARPKSGSKELSSVAFRAKGQALELSFLSPKLVDVQAISAMQPIFFAAVKRDYPDLKSIG